MSDTIRVGLQRWGKDVDETFQELATDDINDCIVDVAKGRRKQHIYTLLVNGRTIEITIRRTHP